MYTLSDRHTGDTESFCTSKVTIFIKKITFDEYIRHINSSKKSTLIMQHNLTFDVCLFKVKYFMYMSSSSSETGRHDN